MLENLVVNQDENLPKEMSFELSKEQLEQVLKKVLDIEAYGTAFSVVGEYYPDVWKDRVNNLKKEMEEPISLSEFSGRALADPYWYKSEVPHALSAYRDYCEFVEGTLAEKLRPQYKGYYYDDYTGDEREPTSEEKDREEILVQNRMKEFENMIKQTGLSTDKPEEEEEFFQKYGALFSKELADGYEKYLKKREESIKKRINGQSFEEFKRKHEYEIRSHDEYASYYKPKDLYREYLEFKKVYVFDRDRYSRYFINPPRKYLSHERYFLI